MRNFCGVEMPLVCSSCLFLVALSLFCSVVAFADPAVNPLGSTISTTLEGTPDCINYGTIDISVDGRLGMRPQSGGTATNSGTITTSGQESYGMYVDSGAEGTNSGNITVTGKGADAVYVNNSIFTNSGTLDSLKGNALMAMNSSIVTLKDGY